MAARGSGVIGNGGKVASPIHVAGGAANAALMLATAGLANAYAGRGVRVVGINPGLTNTDRVAEGLRAEARLSGTSPDESLKRVALARIPFGRMAEPEEIARLVTFLASPQAGYVSGVTITMDGDAAHRGKCVDNAHSCKARTRFVHDTLDLRAGASYAFALSPVAGSRDERSPQTILSPPT